MQKSERRKSGSKIILKWAPWSLFCCNTVVINQCFCLSVWPFSQADGTPGQRVTFRVGGGPRFVVHKGPNAAVEFQRMPSFESSVVKVSYEATSLQLSEGVAAARTNLARLPVPLDLKKNINHTLSPGVGRSGAFKSDDANLSECF